MNDRELFKRVLDALEKVWLLGDGAASMVNPVIAELRARLAEPEQEDYVTWPDGALNELRRTVAEIIGADPDTWPDHKNAALAIAALVSIYATSYRQPAPVKQSLTTQKPSREWVGLTDDEKNKFVGELIEHGIDFVTPLYAQIAKIEAVLKERNHG